MNRRRFLTAAAAAAALAGVRPLTFAQEQPAPVLKDRIKFALKFEMIGGSGSVLEKFQLIKGLGYDGVEPGRPSDIPIDEFLAAKEKTGIEIPSVVDSVHWSQPLSSPDPVVRAKGRAGLERALRDAKALGASSVLLVPAVVNKSMSYADAWDRSIGEIKNVLPLAQEVGVKIAFENVWNNFLLSPLEAARYVDVFKSEWIAFHFDIGNVVNYGWPDQWIRTLGKRVFKLDVKEYSRKKRDNEGLWKGFQVEIGDAEGDCDWPAVRQALLDIDYRGWAAAEVGGGDKDRLADVLARMKRVLA